MGKKLIPKVKIGPKGRIEKLHLGTGILRKTTDIVKERRKKEKKIRKEMGW